MKLLKLTGCLLFLGGGLTRSYGQVQPPLPSLAAPIKQLAIPKDSLLMKKAGQAAKAQADSLLGFAKAPLQQLSQGTKLFEGGKLVSVNKLDVEVDYNYFQDTSGMGLGVFHNMQGTVAYTIDYGVSLTGMPFNMSIRENNGINTTNYTPFQNFYKFNFDHKQYLETLRAKLLEKVSPDALMNSALSRVATIRKSYEQQLRGEISHIQNEYSKEYKLPITLPPNATSLSGSDMNALRTQMLQGAALQKYQSEAAHLQDMLRNKDPKTLAADTNYLRSLGEVKKYETLEKIYSKITGWKTKFEENALVKELRGQSSFSPTAMKAYLSDPNNLGKVLDDQASLSMIQKLFYNISRLDLGQNSVQSGELAMQNVVNTGVNTEFKNKSTSLGVIYGKNNSVNNWQQAGLTSQISNEYTNLTGFKLGTGTGSPIDQSISFNFFHFNNAGTSGMQPGSTSYLPMAPHQDGVISLHSGMQLGGAHSITLDVSKSFGSFQQNGAGDSSKSIPNGSVFNGGGKANYAGILNYTGFLLQTDLNIYIKKVGLGYNNPGNALLRSGESQFGLGLARKFLQQKLTVKYDGDYRRQVFDPAQNYSYSALSNKVQVKYKLSRNDRVGLTYQRSNYHSDFYGQPSTGGTNSRLQLDGSYRFLVGRKKVLNNITISRQEMSIPLTTGGAYSNTSFLITNTSSVMLNKNLLSLTILSNQSDNKTYYFNTSLFSSEANYSYALAGSVRMSSALGYYANAGWNKQIGIRQQLSAAIKSKVNMDLQVGYKKAIQIIQTALANQLFVSAVLHYTFK